MVTPELSRTRATDGAPVPGCIRHPATGAGLDLGAHSRVYAATMAHMTVSMLADRVGVGPDTIRYYERVGLLPTPVRTPAGYRQYDESVVDRLRFIRGAQRLGLRLREIADLLAIRDRGACPCGHTEAVVRQRIAELDAEIARLVEVRQELTRLAAECSAGACPERAWPCEVEFVQAGREVTR
jgi:MerR family mercuric resistance operon transcriptional regulator